MHTQERGEGNSSALIARVVLLVIGATAAFYPAAAQSQSHMSEELRSSVQKVVVLPGRSPASQATTGTYGKESPGLLGGMQAGSRIGDGVSTDIGGIPIGIGFPILRLPGMLFGGLSGKAKQEIQDFRDALTADLTKATGKPLSNDALASDVFWSIWKIPDLDAKVFAPSTPIPNDTDAILYVSLTDVTINVQGKDAIITTSASATLRRVSDGRDLYSSVVQYQDRDTLGNWTRNDNALWRDYTNFARHYIGREISAEVFKRVELQYELRPLETDTVARVKKNEWHGLSRSLIPTLAWELKLLGSDSYGAWASAIDETDISYDVEIYDMHQLVYSASSVGESRHTVVVELEACKKYRWSVRPLYRVGTDIKYGEWMRSNLGASDGNGNIGRKVSEAPAYIQDFASLQIKCGRR